MNFRILGALLAFLCLTTLSTAIPEQQFQTLMQQVGELQEIGSLSEADATVRQILDADQTLTPAQQRALEYELERSRRIRSDYSVTESRLIDSLSESISGFTEQEFRQWDEEGRFDYKHIDGEKRYVGPSRSNLFFRYPDARARRLNQQPDRLERFLWAEYLRVKSESQGPAQQTVSGRRFNCEMTITVKSGVVPQGETIRTWMPYPQQFDAQGGVVLHNTSPDVAWINNPTYPTRSLYFEQPSNGAEPTIFKASYSFTMFPRISNIDPQRVTQPTPGIEQYPEHFAGEQAPHIIFTPEIKQLAADIAGGETNPYLKAKKYYDWICENIKYSYAREYSTLRNISMYVCENRYGDCGQIALLYITLCRAGGIPARWQSGWMLYPMRTNLHDWSEIYIEPYGWIPVDPNFGVDINNGYEWLTDNEREELRNYYFGGLDGYRLVANRDHGYPHYPPKQDFRSDNVDSQRGEVEAGGKNIYYGDFRYRMNAECITPSPDYEQYMPQQ